MIVSDAETEVGFYQRAGSISRISSSQHLRIQFDEEAHVNNSEVPGRHDQIILQGCRYCHS